MAGASTDEEAGAIAGVSTDEVIADEAASIAEDAVSSADEAADDTASSADDAADETVASADEAVASADDAAELAVSAAELMALEAAAVSVVELPRLKTQMRPMMMITATTMMIQVLRFMNEPFLLVEVVWEE